MSDITLDLYKGSEISKGFDTPQKSNLSELDLIKKIGTNFDKGLIGEELLEKALGEVNSLGLDSVEKGHKVELEKSIIAKNEEGAWELSKAGSYQEAQMVEKGEDEDEDEDEEMEDDVEKGDDDDDEELEDKGDDAEEVADGGDSEDVDEDAAKNDMV